MPRIYKIQQPLGLEPGEVAPLFIYTKDRSFEAYIGMNDYWRELLGNRPKIFAELSFESDGPVVLKEYGDQRW